MMTDIEKTIELLMQRVADAEQELDALRRSVRGNFPDAKDGVSVNDRLDALEAPPTTNQDVSLTPYVVPSAAGEGLPQQIELPTVEIEWGIPTEDPTSTPTDTITLQPCDQDGVSYDNADTVVVFIRDDRSDVDLSGRGWLAADSEAEPAVTGTILSFLRFPWWVGSEGSHVDGVLIGEGPGNGSDGQAVTGTYSFCAHYSGYSLEALVPFYTLGGCLNSFLDIGIEARKCSVDEGVGDHPGNAESRISGAMAGIAWGNTITTWSGMPSDEWIDLAYAAVAADGTSLGHGVSAITGINIQGQILADGTLNIQLLNTNSTTSLVIIGRIARVAHSVPQGTIEFGDYCCHEGTGTWGDGVWEFGEEE